MASVRRAALRHRGHQLAILAGALKRKVLHANSHDLIKALCCGGLLDVLEEAVNDDGWHSIGAAVLLASRIERSIAIEVKADVLGYVDADGTAAHARRLGRCNVWRTIGR